MKNCLTIAGSDCSGGAGIQADIKTFSALGCYGMSVITSVFAENTHALLSSMSVSQEVIADQLEAVFSDIRVDAVKIGVLPDTGAMRAVAAALFKYKPEIVVCDPGNSCYGGRGADEQFRAWRVHQWNYPAVQPAHSEYPGGGNAAFLPY